MKQTLDRFIQQNSQGLFLLDPPTGSGKTTVVLDLICSFLKGEATFSKVKRIFFVTNLKTNLPYQELLKNLDDSKKENCFMAKATDDYVIERLLNVEISIHDIRNSKEYKNLRNEVEALQSLRNNFNNEADEEKKNGIAKSIRILEGKIAGDTEPSFRKFIKLRYFYNKSIQDKKEFINNNLWFRSLYPICNIEKYKVVFLTTKRFILPIDTFQRLPFYLYNDDIAKDALFFIDEFDSTKPVILDQIVEDGLKNKIDIIKLFLDINFALQNLTVPKKLLSTTDYHKKKEQENEEGKRWYSTQEHFDYWREAFHQKYEEYNFNYLIKSVDFEYDRAFLFDDGRYFNVFKDSSKKFIYTKLDKREDFLALRAYDYSSGINKTQINEVLKGIEYRIDGFAHAVYYISSNFRHYKNENKKGHEIEYTQEESIYSVLDVLNLSEEEKQYLFSKIQEEDYSFNKPNPDPQMRRGFDFTEIEDSNYHDIKSIIHSYKFHITPEDVIIKLVEKALVVGISATAKVKTCIGNYDLMYIGKKIGDKLTDISKEDENRIVEQFNSMIAETENKYSINVNIVDDVLVFSDREKCEELIAKLFSGEMRVKYLRILDESKTDAYYFLIELKLATIYADMKKKGYKSFIGFLNAFPRVDGKFNKERLLQIFSDIDECYVGPIIRVEIVNSGNYDNKFESIYKDLGEGKAVYILTTYQTIGSGKNIQYCIPDSEEESVSYCRDDIYHTKDFDAIYLLTPTNLLQSLSYESENRYADLAKYLFQQEYLYQNKHLNYYEMKHNIANGFRRTFFQDQFPFYVKNGDIYANTLRLTIQAVGRICRCRNKNKQIYIYSDREVVERVQHACNNERPKLLNKEFESLLFAKFKCNKITKIVDYSSQSKRAFCDIKDEANKVRVSRQNVETWKALREYVLQNPTSNFVDSIYSSYYFEFPDKYTGYSYKYGKDFSIVDIKTDIRYQDMEQVSEQACDLPIILSSKKYIMDLFQANNYATTFIKGKYIMSPSLFKQVYLGALGEVVGRVILEKELGYNLQELDDTSYYEFFDYKFGNIYFDFKHWDTFRIDAATYSAKIERKLSRIKGAKCFIINLIKRTDSKPVNSVDETIIQIPYLIDGDKGIINEEGIEFIQKMIDT